MTCDNEGVPNAPWWHACSQRCCAVQIFAENSANVPIFSIRFWLHWTNNRFLLLYQSLHSNLASVMIPAHDDGPNLYTHNLRSMDKKLSSDSLLKTASRRFWHLHKRSSHITASMIAGWIQAIHYTILPRVVVLHNTMSSAYKEKKLRAYYQHFTRSHSQFINGAHTVQFLRQQLLNFWLDDVTGTVKQRNCG